jgi:chromosome partitioning protein
MQTLAMIAQKGGTGKTTLALSLAVAAEAAGQNVLVIDLDPQASACRWGDRRTLDAPTVMDAQPARLAAALAKAAQAGVDLVIVDTPARVEQAAAEAAKVADLVLIPCKPSILDLETLRTTAELVQGRAKRPPLVIMNAVPAQGTRHEQAAEAITSMGLAICPAQVGQRVAFEYATQAGLTVTEYEPDGRAASDIRHLYTAICRVVGMSKMKEAMQ